MSEDTTPKKKKAPMTVMKERIAALEEENAALKEQLAASLQNAADMADRAEDIPSETVGRLEAEIARLEEKLGEANQLISQLSLEKCSPDRSGLSAIEGEDVKVVAPVDRAAALKRINEIEERIAMGGLSDGERKMLKIEKRDLQLSL